MWGYFEEWWYDSVNKRNGFCEWGYFIYNSIFKLSKATPYFLVIYGWDLNFCSQNCSVRGHSWTLHYQWEFFTNCVFLVSVYPIKYKNRSPTHQLICIRCQFRYVFSFSFVYFPVLVFKSRLQTNGIYSLIIFFNAIQIVDLKSS